jgi:hypothetical protein
MARKRTAELREKPLRIKTVEGRLQVRLDPITEKEIRELYERCYSGIPPAPLGRFIADWLSRTKEQYEQDFQRRRKAAKL